MSEKAAERRKKKAVASGGFLLKLQEC